MLISGGAGLGKTSVVRAFAAAAAGRARVLLCSCDDLMAPRTLGPLRDAALESGGSLAAAFADDRPVDDVFTAVMAELAAAPPTALVVEDVHWADDATIDVLGYVARRIEPVPAVLVLSFRDDELGASHPLQRMLGGLAGRPVRRLALPPLSRTAVRRLAASTGADGDAVHRVTGGNPFFVTEALASPADAVPATVVEAVLARVARLAPACREALEQLSVVPSRVRFELAAEVLGERIDTLAEAELAGVLEVSPSHLGFRHELARRAIERSLPALARRRLNAQVLHALQQQERPDRASLMHFAVEAGDVETVLAVGPEAAREAARAGSHRQALAHLESVRPHLSRLGERERAAVLDDYGWELYNAHRFREAVDAGREAAALYEQLDDPVAVAHALVRASRHLFMAGETVEAEECADRAVAILEPAGDAAALAAASLHRGAILALTDEFERAAGSSRSPATAPSAPAAATSRRWPSTTSGSRPSSAATPAVCAWCATAWRSRSAGPTSRSPPAATATSRSCCTARDSSTSLRRASPKVSRSRATAGSGRTPTTSSCTAACCSSAAATSTARSRGCASWSTGSRTRGCCSPTACPGSAARSRAAATRRRAGCWPGPGTARSASGSCSAWRTPAWPRWNGRGWPGGRRSPSAWRPRSRRDSRTPAPRPSGPS